MTENKEFRDEFNKETEQRIKKCDDIQDFDERIKCKCDLLYQITEVQDYMNLDIMDDFRKTDPNCSTDSRWLPIHLIDNVNAVILGISRFRLRPNLFLRDTYVSEKMDGLISKWYHIKREKEE